MKAGANMTLEAFFKDNPVVALGFSGGVDSSYLLYAGIKYGASVKAYYVKTPFQPEFEFKDACRMAEYLHADMKVIKTDILSVPEVSANPADRCFYCKTAIFSLISGQALADGYTLLIDGTNASDDAGDRPGMRALNNLGVRSPLRECGLTKDRIRELSKEAGLFTWDKPAYACLATRIPAGTKITAGLLNKIENSENILFDMGFSDFRVRTKGNAAVIQLPAAQISSLMASREKINEALKPYFNQILLDLKTR